MIATAFLQFLSRQNKTKRLQLIFAADHAIEYTLREKWSFTQPFLRVYRERLRGEVSLPFAPEKSSPQNK